MKKITFIILILLLFLGWGPAKWGQTEWGSDRWGVGSWGNSTAAVSSSLDYDADWITPLAVNNYTALWGVKYEALWD